MDGVESKNKQNSSSLKAHRNFMAAQSILRIAAIGATVAAASLMVTSKQSTVVFGIGIDARYNYTSAFKFFALVNFIAAALSLLSLFVAFFIGRKASEPKHYFLLFLHDLVVAMLLMSACAAATAIGFIGRYGNSHAGWMAICDHFGKFCNRVTVSVMMSYFGLVIYLCLAVISASKSRQVPV